MTKIEELIDSLGNQYDWDDIQVSQIMREYAEFYAKKCLEIAAENATGTPKYDFSNPYTSTLIEDSVNIDENSILNIKLPEHE